MRPAVHQLVSLLGLGTASYPFPFGSFIVLVALRVCVYSLLFVRTGKNGSVVEGLRVFRSRKLYVACCIKECIQDHGHVDKLKVCREDVLSMF